MGQALGKARLSAEGGLNKLGNASVSAIWSTMPVPAMSIPAFSGPNGLSIGVQVIAANGADR
jgi:Asp-tRNA(Asn)/Glu-tRNA(Gln) amidotransferase A subunit family amidase